MTGVAVASGLRHVGHDVGGILVLGEGILHAKARFDLHRLRRLAQGLLIDSGALGVIESTLVILLLQGLEAVGALLLFLTAPFVEAALTQTT